MRIGVFGGTFDPVHVGHLKLASHALSELNLDRVIFVPAKQNPLKTKDTVLPATLRLRLLRLALRNRPRFSVSTVELTRRGKSYTVNTLSTLKKKFGKKAVLYLLTGADSAETFRRWKNWPRIVELCRPVVLSRPGHALSGLPEGCLGVPFDAIDVSSTEIRKRVLSGKNFEKQVPAAARAELRRYARFTRKTKGGAHHSFR